MSLGNLIILSIESFCIAIICFYLMSEAQKTMKKHKEEGTGSDGTALNIVAILWLLWRFWLTASSIAAYLGRGWP